MNIVLIGMPSSGKTTCGKPLAKRLGMDFVDTDNLMEKNAHKDIHQILQEGTGYFSSCESSAGIEASKFENTVIATGGSMIYQENAMLRLKESGLVVFIKTCVEEIVKNTEGRALIRGNCESIQDLFDERQPYYLRYADIIVDRDNKSIEDLVSEICLKFRENQ